MAFVLATYS